MTSKTLEPLHSSRWNHSRRVWFVIRSLNLDTHANNQRDIAKVIHPLTDHEQHQRWVAPVAIPMATGGRRQGGQHIDDADISASFV